jgi:hypothetical protein
MNHENKDSPPTTGCKSKECISCRDVYRCNEIKDSEAKEWALYRIGKGVKP